VPTGLDGFLLPPSQRQKKKNLCDLCDSSEAGGEKVIEITKLLAVIYNDPVADNKIDPPRTINFYRQHNKYCHYN